MSKKCNNECKKTSIGGQALIEGIMMRGPKYTAMAVRDPRGELVLEKWKTSEKEAPKWAKLPVVRGVYAFVSSMVTGYKSLMRSAEISGLEEAEEELRREKAEKKAKKLAKKNKKQNIEAVTAEAVDTSLSETKNTEETPKVETEVKKKNKKEGSPLVAAVMTLGSVLGVALSVGLFILLPVYIYQWCTPIIPESITSNMWLNTLTKSVFEGVLRIIVLVAYMLLVSLMKDIRRTFKYHGAEHKTIFCYEHGNRLTVENVRREGRFHPRCGTSFLILMLIVGIFISFFIDPIFLLILKDPALLKADAYPVIRFGVKLLLTPMIMGLGYELIKFAGKHDNLVTKVISAPGMWLQHITVLEPDDDMIECAIRAFVEVMPDEEKEMYYGEDAEEARSETAGETDSSDSTEHFGCDRSVSCEKAREEDASSEMTE